MTFTLSMDGYSVEYDCRSYHVIVMGEGVSGRFRIASVDVEPHRVVLKGDDRDGYDWSLEDEREEGPLIHMAGAPLRRREDRIDWSGEFYNRGWPELEETCPSRPWSDNCRDDDCQRRRGEELSKAASALMCDSPEPLFPEGLKVRTGWNTELTLRAEVWPQGPSDIRCCLVRKGDGWRLEAHGRGRVGERVGFSSGDSRVCLVMTPHSTGDLEHLARLRANDFRRYRDGHPPYIPGTVGKPWEGSHGSPRSIYSFEDDVWLESADRWRFLRS